MLALNNGQDITRRLEDRYCIYSRTNTYIMLENVEINWYWTSEEVNEFDKSMRAGMNVIDLAEKFGRTHEEIVLLAIDRSMRDTIARSTPSHEGSYKMLESVGIDWFWEMNDVFMFDVYHKSGISIESMAKALNKTEAEIIIMTFDRALQDKI